MKARIVRVENGYWRVYSKKREVGTKEQAELNSYLKRTRLPHKLIDGRICIPSSVGWNEIDKKLVPFYDGRAEVTPF